MRRVKGTAFVQVAKRVLDNAKFLLRHGRWHSAIYLAGYSVECLLKAAICQAKGFDVLPSEYQTHELRSLLESTGLGQELRRDRTLVQAFERVNKIWSVEIRYASKPYGRSEAIMFFGALGRLIPWLETKMRMSRGL